MKLATLAAAILMPFAASAQSADCDIVMPIAESHGALSRTYSAMVRWCIDNDVTQPACQELGDLTQKHDLEVRQATAAAATGAAIRSCSNRSPKPSAQPE